MNNTKKRELEGALAQATIYKTLEEFVIEEQVSYKL